MSDIRANAEGQSTVTMTYAAPTLPGRPSESPDAAPAEHGRARPAGQESHDGRTPRRPGRGVLAHRAAPLVALALVSLCSLGLRAAWLSNPRTLVFDENYYVNAARTIDGLAVPPDAAFSGNTPGRDPNLEHPPLAKVIIAGSIRLFGDNPIGWRAPSLLFGSLALLALYGLVRGAGGSPWTAVGAAAVLASDTLFLVHGRIATLDIFVVPFMIAGVALYIRRRPVYAGVLIGIGACTKVVGLYAVGIVAVLELLRLAAPKAGDRPSLRRRGLALMRPLGACTAVAASSYLLVLDILDRRFSVMRNPFEHTRFMLSYASNLPAHPHAPTGVAFAPTSSPWQWLLNHNPILYYQHLSAAPARHTLVLFQGRMNPFVIYLALPALAVAAYTAWRQHDDASRLALAWFVATFGASVVVSLHHRFNYLYYMVVVLPAIAIAISQLFAQRVVPRLAIVAYGATLVFGLWATYPFRTWGGV